MIAEQPELFELFEEKDTQQQKSKQVGKLEYTNKSLKSLLNNESV